MKNKFWLFCLFMMTLLSVEIGYSQQMKAVSFKEKTSNLYASTKVVTDHNGVPCALVRVQMVDEGAEFEGNVMSSERRTGEYWVYMSAKSKKLTVRHNRYLAAEVNFNDYGIKELNSKTVYELVIETPIGPKNSENTRVAQQYVSFEVTPKNAVVELDGTVLEVTDGTAVSRKPFGVYGYNVSASLYHPFSGQVAVNDPVNKHLVTVSLKPAFGYLAIPESNSNKGAKVFLDGKEVGTVPFQSDRLPSGTHALRLVRSQYKTLQSEVVIQDGKTFTFRSDMAADFAEVELRVKEGDGDIHVNGTFKGKGSWKGTLSSGSYLVECKKEHHTSTTYDLIVTPSSNGKVFMIEQPQPITTSLDIQSKPANADVFIDGKKVGSTPIFLPAFIVGDHSVKVTKNGYESFTKDVRLTKEKSAEFVCELKKQTEQTQSSLHQSTQELEVNFWGKRDKDLSAITAIVYDLNKKPCALVKVQLVADNVSFENVTVVEDKGGNEYWVYLPEGTKRMTVKTKDYLKLVVNFADHGAISSVVGKTVYELRISPKKIEKSRKEIENEAYKEFLIKKFMAEEEKHKQEEEKQKTLREETVLNEQEVDNKIFTVSGVSFKMVRVEGGSFNMGATPDQGDETYENEKPVHRVSLRTFSIGETEVTQALWEAVMGDNPSNFKGANLPVERVTWEDCQSFIAKLNAMTGMKFRMPTDEEWEYAARGGIKSKGFRYSGSDVLNEVAWVLGNSSQKTHPVKTKKPNELGIYDMSGNVCEWCQDYFYEYGKTTQAPTTMKIWRGGGWRSKDKFCRNAYRNKFNTDKPSSAMGFRLVMD